MKLVIFDCDGTLVDSELLCNLAMEQQLRILGIESNANELLEKYRGVKFTQVLSSIEETYNIRLPSTFESSYRENVASLFETQLKAIDGIKEVLAEVKLPICVASSAPRKKVKHALKVTGLHQFFGDHIFSCYDIQKWKPDPDIFIHAANEMEVNVDDCLVVEDSPVGVNAALKAKIKCIQYSAHSQPVLDSNVLQIKHMSELSQILNQYSTN